MSRAEREPRHAVQVAAEGRLVGLEGRGARGPTLEEKPRDPVPRPEAGHAGSHRLQRHDAPCDLLSGRIVGGRTHIAPARI